jgi:hypothetical protein
MFTRLSVRMDHSGEMRLTFGCTRNPRTRWCPWSGVTDHGWSVVIARSLRAGGAAGRPALTGWHSPGGRYRAAIFHPPSLPLGTGTAGRSTTIRRRRTAVKRPGHRHSMVLASGAPRAKGARAVLCGGLPPHPPPAGLIRTPPPEYRTPPGPRRTPAPTSPSRPPPPRSYIWTAAGNTFFATLGSCDGTLSARILYRGLSGEALSDVRWPIARRSSPSH